MTIWQAIVAVFLAGVTYAGYKQSRKDVDGLGRKVRSMEDEQERRWKHDLATALDQVDHPTAKAVAEKLRQDAYRN